MESVKSTTPVAMTIVDGDNASHNYETVRFNALKHGILSKHVVLPYEEKGEFEELLTCLTAEHQPSGATEVYLVEELAGIMWRKRRVLLAEGAKINRNIRVSLHGFDGTPCATVKNGMPTEPALADACIDFRGLVSTTQKELQSQELETLRNLEAIEKADLILRPTRQMPMQKR